MDLPPTSAATARPLVLLARADAAVLSINETMGFTAVACEGAWKKVLS